MSKVFLPQKEATSTFDIEAELISNNVFKGDGTTKPNADISWNNHKIVDLADASLDGDAVNKKYADNLKIDFKNVQVTEDKNFKGFALKSVGNASADSDAINKKQAQNMVQKAALYMRDRVILLNGASKPLANISWNNYRITDLGRCLLPSDAVNKAYVDNAGQYYTIYAELDGPIDAATVFSFGSSKAGNIKSGYVFATPGLIIKGSISSINLNGEASTTALSISPTINGTKSTRLITKPANSTKGFSTFTSSLAFIAGDVLNFASRSVDTAAYKTVVAVIVKVKIK